MKEREGRKKERKEMEGRRRKEQRRKENHGKQQANESELIMSNSLRCLYTLQPSATIWELAHF